MAANSSSNDSLLHSDASFYISCFFTKPSSFIFTAFNIMKVLLLLPLCVFVIYLGLKRRRRQRSASAAAAVTSHSDVFTYHAVAMGLISLLGFVLCSCGIFTVNVKLYSAGNDLWTFSWCGQASLNLLTCVERYLAVVHPVTYLSLRGERGTRIRNISIGCVWLLCCISLVLLIAQIFDLLHVCMMFFSFIIVSFCSLAVLCVLIRPGPGEQGGDRGRVDQSKRRAFYTMLAILGVLMLKCFGDLFWLGVLNLPEGDSCLLSAFEFWFDFPCSLVLPLLFLHRAGTLACCKNSNK